MLGVIVLWKVLGVVLGGDAPQAQIRPPLTVTGPSGSLGTGDAPPAPAGTVAATFPASVDGTRLELKVIALGVHPPECVAQGVRTGSKTLTVFHHRCVQEPGLDRYFFLVRLTNHSKGRVYVNLDGFTVEPVDGKPRPAFPTPPVGSPSTRFIADTRAFAAHQSIKGWITIDGTDGFLWLPARRARVHRRRRAPPRPLPGATGSSHSLRLDRVFVAHLLRARSGMGDVRHRLRGNPRSRGCECHT